jgi:hypothetical protein
MLALIQSHISNMDVQADHKLYEKLFDTLLVLRDARERFHCYSAADIKKLIATKMNAKTLREPAALAELYKLETMIRELRESMEAAKSEV